MSSVFVPPDIQTVTNAAAAALASENICAQIAAGLSSSPYAYMLDGVSPAAIMSAPKGLFTLNGAQVALSSLLSFSSAAKYTVGPDGNYVLNSANGPAWDWSTGRRRLLIEAIGATNYWLNSENGAAWGLINGASASTAANALFGTLSLTTLTSGAAAAPGASANAGIAAVNGDVISVTTAFIAGDLSDPVVQLCGSTSDNGLNADSVASILSGPGALTQIFGGVFHLTGLSTTVPTIVRVTRTYRTSETAATYIYMTRHLPSGDFTPGAGHTLKMGRPQFEPGYGSSYIVSGASPTARAADVVTAASGLLALLKASNATIAFRAKMLAANPASAYMFLGDDMGSLFYTNTSAELGAWDSGVTNAVVADYAGASSDLGAVLSYTGYTNGGGGGARKLCGNGGTVINNAHPQFNSGIGSLTVGGGSAGYTSNMLLDELVVWPILASDAGIQAQARVYS